MGIFRRRRSTRPRNLHLAVTVAGEPAFLLDLTPLLYGHVHGAVHPDKGFMRGDYPVMPGARPGTNRQAVVTFTTQPTVGVWIGDPGAFETE